MMKMKHMRKNKRVMKKGFGKNKTKGKKTVGKKKKRDKDLHLDAVQTADKMLEEVADFR